MVERHLLIRGIEIMNKLEINTPEVEEETHNCGDLYLIEDAAYIMAIVDSDEYNLVNIRNGCRFLATGEPTPKGVITYIQENVSNNITKLPKGSTITITVK